MPRARWAGVALIVPVLMLARRCPEWMEHQRDVAARDRETRVFLDSAYAQADSIFLAAQAFGRTADQAACLARQTEMMVADEKFAFSLAFSHFVEGCYEHAKPTPGFCAGVPPLRLEGSEKATPAEIAASNAWQGQHCADHPAAERECLVQARVHQQYCNNEGRWGPDYPTREELRRAHGRR
jgi:hypothetical protein